MLSNKFALIFDGWTCEQSTTHYLAISASFLWKDTGEPEKALLSFAPFPDEASYTATDHKDSISLILKIFSKTLENVVCLIGDNCATNQKLARDCGIPLVGCAAHRFNLEVQAWLDKNHDDVIQKVWFDEWTQTNLEGAQIDDKSKHNEDTRRNPWTHKFGAKGSQYHTLDRSKWHGVQVCWLPLLLLIRVRYFKLESILEEIEALESLLLTKPEKKQLTKLLALLQKLHSVMMALQDSKLTLSQAHCLFDGVMQQFPEM